MLMAIFPLLSYVLISTFTPGPSNISSASVASLHGYRKTLMYQGGLALGVFTLMLLSGLVSATLLSIFPAVEPILRYAGAAYILYLAFGILKASYTFSDPNARPVGFVHGLTLNLLNPKLVVYSFTLFSGFLAPISGHTALLVFAAVLLAAISFGSTSTWALFGSTITTRLHDPRWKLAVNILLALFLVYAAVELTGLV